MLRRSWLGGAAGLLLAACMHQEGAPAPSAQAAPPDEVVKRLYAPYANGRGGSPTPLPDAAPWTDEFRTLIDRTLALSDRLNEPIIDFDPFTGAQDVALSNLRIVVESPPANGRAVVAAAFHNIDRDDRVTYDLVEVAGAWRIENVRGSDWSLRQMCEEALAAHP